MAFTLLSLTIFIIFLQPASIFPGIYLINPVRNITIISIIVYILFGDKNRVNFINNKTNRYLLMYAGINIFSGMLIWLGYIRDSLVVWLLYLIIYFLLVKQCFTMERIKKIALMIVIAVAYLSYYSLTKFVVNFQLGGRAGGFGWYENPNDLSLILVCTIPLAMLLAESTKGGFRRLPFYFLAGMFFLNVLFTGSRSGLLAVILVSTMSIYFTGASSKLLKSAILIILLFSIIGTGLSVVLGRGDLKGLLGDDSSENRLIQWEAGFRMVKANPFFGVGPDGFEQVATDYQGIGGLAPHNTLLQVFAETGIPGGCFFVMFACYPLLVSWSYIKKNWRHTNKSAAQIYHQYLFAALCGFWVCAFFSNRYKSYILYVLIALLVAVNESIAINNTEYNSNKSVPLNTCC